MSKLLRLITKPHEWAEFEQSSFWENGDCPPALLLQIFEGRGISVYQTDSQAAKNAKLDEQSAVERMLTAVALSWKNKLAPVNYVLLDTKVIKEIGVRVVQSSSKTCDIVTSQSHCDLMDVSAKSLVEIAKVMKASEIKTFRPDQAMKTLYKLVNSTDVTKVGLFKKAHPEIMWDLWDNDFIDIEAKWR